MNIVSRKIDMKYKYDKILSMTDEDVKKYNNDYFEFYIPKILELDYKGICIDFGIVLSDKDNIFITLGSIELIPLDMIFMPYTDLLMILHFYDFSNVDDKFNTNDIIIKTLYCNSTLNLPCCFEKESPNEELITEIKELLLDSGHACIKSTLLTFRHLYPEIGSIEEIDFKMVVSYEEKES